MKKLAAIGILASLAGCKTLNKGPDVSRLFCGYQGALLYDGPASNVVLGNTSVTFTSKDANTAGTRFTVQGALCIFAEE